MLAFLSKINGFNIIFTVIFVFEMSGMDPDEDGAQDMGDEDDGGDVVPTVDVPVLPPSPPPAANDVLLAAAAAPTQAAPGDGWAHATRSLDKDQKKIWISVYCVETFKGKNHTRVRSVIFLET
jgi:hypothetical protein